MKAHPAETFMESAHVFRVEEVVEYIQQATQVRHAQHNKHPLQG